MTKFNSAKKTKRSSFFLGEKRVFHLVDYVEGPKKKTIYQTEKIIKKAVGGDVSGGFRALQLAAVVEEAG